MDSVRGQLLIAGPALLDPNFWRTVVLVVEHSDDGALGLVLNRPSETSVGEAVTELDELLDADDLLFIGGPVQPSAVIVLAQFEDAGDAALMAFDDVGVVGSGTSPEELAAGCARRGRSSDTPVGARPARRGARARRLDPRARNASRRVRERAARSVADGADAEGRQLRARRPDAR